jgi:hypothetical protein
MVGLILPPCALLSSDGEFSEPHFVVTEPA